MEEDMRDPFQHFAEWFREAEAAVPVDPNAMVLSTVGADGRPSSRVVLLKGFDAEGFVFYGNLESRKFRELRDHPWAALNFHWKPLGKQVRIEGRTSQVTAAEADAYFATRPRVSQLGAWASEQSQPLTSREALEARLTVLTAKYEGKPVPRPPHWGGYRLKPERIEFWKAHEFRLHWREEYVKSGDAWQHSWLNP
jgi:pyridoxamine 5'-phosphate oxidase